jgi:hypothetical protein
VATGSQGACFTHFTGIARLGGQAFSGEIDSGTPVDRSYERIVYNFYGKPPYWHEKIEEDVASK